MQKIIIKKLNHLNKDFYQTVAEDFSDSRQYFWQGWKNIIKYLKKLSKNEKKIKILDIASGNARFAQFLNQEKINFQYFALDNSAKFLKITQQITDREKIDSQRSNFDLVDNYLKNGVIDWPFTEQFHLIVAFGITHHLPSFNLRLNFFESLKALLKSEGILIVSNWQFAQEERFKKNILNWSKIKNNAQLNSAQKKHLKYLLDNLEKNDYLLDWRKESQASTNKTVFRYCHHLNYKACQKLIDQSGFKLLDYFQADGKSQQLNDYFVLKKVA